MKVKCCFFCFNGVIRVVSAFARYNNYGESHSRGQGNPHTSLEAPPFTGDNPEAQIHSFSTALHRAQNWAARGGAKQVLYLVSLQGTVVRHNVTFPFSRYSLYHTTMGKWNPASSRPQQITNEMAHGRLSRQDPGILHTAWCLMTLSCPSCKHPVGYTGSSDIQAIKPKKKCDDSKHTAAQISPTVNPSNSTQDAARPLVQRAHFYSHRQCVSFKFGEANFYPKNAPL